PLNAEQGRPAHHVGTRSVLPAVRTHADQGGPGGDRTLDPRIKSPPCLRSQSKFWQVRTLAPLHLDHWTPSRCCQRCCQDRHRLRRHQLHAPARLHFTTTRDPEYTRLIQPLALTLG